MMSEGSQVDWGGHANDAEYLISELIDFDETIGAVLDFAEKDGETLVIVTSDHETGGFTLSGKKYTDTNGHTHNDYRTIDPSFSTRILKKLGGCRRPPTFETLPHMQRRAVNQHQQKEQ